MLTIIRGFSALILSLALISFAVSNRHPIPVTLFPMSEPLDIPLYMVALSLMGVGFIIGALSVWTHDAHIRHDRRRQKKSIKNLEKELKGLRHDPITNVETLVSDFFPDMPADQGLGQKQAKK